MAEPLEGFMVVEMAVAVQGPAAALYLRDMGAEVIKVEPPLGDASRYSRGVGNDTPDGIIGPQYITVNRGKRSVCIDINTPDGILAIHRLLEKADVFLTNFREPALVEMGLGYDDIKSRYPQLVYASVNGFGPIGPDADKAMLDGAAAARGGLINHTGYPDRAPSLPGAVVIDTSGAMHLALGVMTALLSRERFGVAQRVQTSALGTTLWLQQWEITHVNMTGAELTRAGNHHGNISGPYGVYSTKDGGAILFALAMDLEAWDSLCIFAEAFDLSIDPRFQTPGQRLGEGLTEEDSVEVRQRLTSIFESKTTKEWQEFLYTQPEIIWERVRNWSEVLDDEQNIANNYVTSVEVAGLGATRTVGNLVTLSETAGSTKGNAPELGEANSEILGSLGFSSNECLAIETHATKVREEYITALLEAVAAVSKDPG